MTLSEMSRELASVVEQAKNAYAAADAARKSGDTATLTAEREKFHTLSDAAASLKADIARMEELEKVSAFVNENPGSKSAKTGVIPAPEDATDVKRAVRPLNTRSLREQMMSMEVRSRVGEQADGQPYLARPYQKGQPFTVRNVAFSGVLGNPETRALYALDDDAGGVFIQPFQQSGIVETFARHPFNFLDVIGVQSVNTDTIEYFKFLTSVNNADTVPEWDPTLNAGAGGFGLKPESDMTFGMASTNVYTIATWVGMSRQVLADAPRLRAIVNTELSFMIRYALEGKVLNGSGTDEIRGLRNTSGILTRVHQTGSRASIDDTIADTLRRGITDVSLEGYMPDNIVAHPYIAEDLELLKDEDKNYLQIFDPIAQRLWRVPIVQSTRMPVDEAIIGNFALGCVLWDRQTSEIRVGEPGDYFLRNALAILAELRAGFGVPRPKAFLQATSLA